MSLFALGLVLGSAVVHATWNLLAKRAKADTPFLWLAYVIGAVAYAPLAIAILVIAQPTLGWHAFLFIAVAVGLQTVYFKTLTAGYRAGDLSLVYPIARATGPLLATGVAIAFMDEEPTPVALVGALAILAGGLIVTADARLLRSKDARQAIGFALATGAIIGTYTVWDKTAVSMLLIPPLLYDWATVTGQALAVAPVALRDRGELRRVWTEQRGALLGVGILSRLSYILVLTALAVSPVSYVAPAREIGILIGAVMGASLLAEGNLPRRVLGAAAMVAGVIALAVG